MSRRTFFIAYRLETITRDFERVLAGASSTPVKNVLASRRRVAAPAAFPTQGHMVNVVCMKWGTLYGSHYVNRLYRGVARNMSRPFRFVCFTDDPAGVEAPVECKPLPPITLPEGYEGSAFRKIRLRHPPGTGWLPSARRRNSLPCATT